MVKKEQDYTLPISPVYDCIPRIYSIFCCLEKYVYILADVTQCIQNPVFVQ